MSRRRRDRHRRPRGFTPPGFRELHNVALPALGAEKRAFFNHIADRLVVMAGVAMAIVGYGQGGLAGAVVGMALGLSGAGRAMARGRFRR